MKKLLNLKGAHELSKSEQTSINGGGTPPCGGGPFVTQFHLSQQQCIWYGYQWHEGRCYACL